MAQLRQIYTIMFSARREPLTLCCLADPFCGKCGGHGHRLFIFTALKFELQENLKFSCNYM